jgi:Protein of unknown function (DUF3383)
MPTGLAINRLVRTSINLAPLAAARRGFGVLLICGDSDVIDAVERVRTYTGLDSVADDFGTTAPEYLAAQLYFGQTPRPSTLMIGRWLRTASVGFLRGATLTTGEQAMANFTGITDGGFQIDIDGVTVDLSGNLDFSAETNLNGVASIIDTELGAAGSCVWTGSRFEIKSATTGVLSEVDFAVAPLSGTNVITLLKLSSALALTPIPGFAAEEPVDCIETMDDVSGVWFGVMFAALAANMPDTDQIVAAAGLVEGLTLDRIYGVTETDTRILDSSFTTDIASTLEPLNYKRTFVQYSANLYAVASFFGRAFSVNFSANKSTITMMYKVEPGVAAETITESQAQTLKAKRANVFVNYQNDTAIIQYGVMSGDAYFDEVHGLSWLKDAIQTSVYNVLYQGKTKIPQTDAGVNQLVNAVSKACDEGVFNGLIAQGQWNADGFGQLATGDYLTSGYYIYTQPIALQDQSIREQRISPPIQVAIKLAGAIHEVDVIVDVNR